MCRLCPGNYKEHEAGAGFLLFSVAWSEAVVLETEAAGGSNDGKDADSDKAVVVK